MPSVPLRERIVANEQMVVVLVFRFRLFAKLAPFQSWNDDPPCEIVQVQWTSVSRLEDRADRQFPHPVSVRLKRLSQLFHNRDGSLAPRILGFRRLAVPNGLLNAQLCPRKVF